VQQNKGGGLQLSKLFGLFSLSILFSTTYIYATTFEEFKRTQSDNYTKFKDENDNAFSKFLKEEWSAYKSVQGKVVYKVPKPDKIPKTASIPIKKVGPKVDIKVIKKNPMKMSSKIIVKKDNLVQKEDDIVKNLYIDFFGSKYGFNVPQGFKDSNFFPRDTNGVRNFFNSVAGSEYDELLADIKKLQKKLDLNDWAIYLLINKLSASIHSNQDNASLLSWFIFNKLGYSVKVGLVHKHIILMYYSKKDIYSTPSYTFNKKRYYVIANYNKGSVGRIYSYPHDYPDANKAIDLSLNKLPKFNYIMKYKDLTFVENGKKYNIGFNYNQNLIDFMATYPQADYETYFNAPLEKDTYDEIATKLKEFVDGKKMSEAINFVLHFVQKSFKYQVDEAQFGREKVMFAQETLYYDKSDCEDRAVLFSTLVNSLFKVGVVGVKYKDHISTALYIPINGDSVRTASRRFVIADPTYINSNIGQNMPKYRSIRPDRFVIVKRL